MPTPPMAARPWELEQNRGAWQGSCAPSTDNFAHGRAAIAGEATKAGPAVGDGVRLNLQAKSFLCMSSGEWECEKIVT
jgi:hypothetical protein